MSSVVPLGVAIAVYVLFLLTWVLVVPAFAYFSYHDVQPARARSKALSAITALGYLPLATITFASHLTTANFCITEMAISAIAGNAVIFAFCCHAWRLLIIFNITGEKIEATMEKEEKTKKSLLRHLVSNPFFLKEKVLFGSVMCCVACFGMLMVGAVALEITNDRPASGACDNAIYQGSWSLFTLFIVVLFTALLIKLRKVHDAFFVKKEFIGRCACVVFGVVPGLVLSFAAPQPQGHEVGTILYIIAQTSALWVAFGIPSYLSYKNLNTGFSSSTEVSMTTDSKIAESADIDYALEVVDGQVERSMLFSEYPRIAKLLQDSISEPFIKEYLLDFQDMEMSDTLNFWTQVQEFRKLPKDFLGGKAYLLYQKFLSRDAYRKIDCITNSLREHMEKEIDHVVNNPNATNIEPNFFDEVIKIAEERMADQLFKRFFKSKFYVQYRTAAKLKRVMGEV